MRTFTSTLCVVGLLGLFVGCRSQTTAMTNPFLAPDRVPPPPTRTLLPGTAQPYYPGDPVPNSPAVAPPPAVSLPAVTPQPGYQPPSTFAPPAGSAPAGAVPPGGWNGSTQPIPSGYVSAPVAGAPVAPIIPPVPVQVSPYPNQVAVLPTQIQQPVIQQATALGAPREVQIRAISSENLPAEGGAAVSRDGFRPQGSSQVLKPTIASRLVPRKRAAVDPPSDRFGFDPQYGWIRGQLQQAADTGAWMLSYQPGSSEDPFGGSLPIANPEALGNLPPGEFVVLRGELAESGPHGVSPAYHVSVVQRQRI